ncbi:tetratricopeptide repeat protein [Caballeronia temeraria]|uniref:Tetratricopeptide repeat protein n=1 Tax=Caballeronia temeraria TaxID=1777137 RepID=A0A158AAU5_9BURK|nr:tetratricopeptide repeat protein [Caballeronia temeraria]SAK54815.1 tetratricopeptide repeat protein [Caballeronia temeraria]
MSSDLYHRAVQHYSQNQHAEALAVLSPLLDRPHADAEVLDLAAGCAYAMNRPDRAQAYWERAVAEHPRHAGVDNHLGNLYAQLEKLPEAEALYRRSLDLKTDVPETHNNLGNVLMQQGRAADAEQSLRRALELRPDLVPAHYSLGKLLMTQARVDEAQMHFQHAIEARPDWADAHLNLGNAFVAQQRWDEGERAYRAAIELNPSLTIAYQSLAELLEKHERYGDLESVYRRLSECVPDLRAAHYNLGQVLYRITAFAGLERLDEAEAAYRRAIDLEPDHVQAYIALGNLLKEQPARLNEMLDVFRRAVELAPQSGEARLNLGGGLLRVGEYAQGWPLMEVRYDDAWPQRPIPPPDLPFPRWQGEPLAGKSLLVIHEQGFGDSFQFCRYLPMLKAQGLSKLSVVWALEDPLLASADGVDVCVSAAALHTLPPHDYWCFMMSAPALLGTTLETIPSVTPYLFADDRRVERWRDRLPARVPTVGIAAMSEPRPNPFDTRRGSNAPACMPLLGLPGVRFVNLQKAPVSRAQLDTLPPHLRPLDLMDDVQDFSDTAAIIASLDLVISVDTSVAHLAGALGKPLWVLLSTNPCWRWHTEGETSAWYPNARLFRQTAPNNWDDVIARVTAALAEWRDRN